MALVNIIDVNVLDNPAAFTNPFQFEITFECLQELQEGEMRLIYSYCPMIKKDWCWLDFHEKSDAFFVA